MMKEGLLTENPSKAHARIMAWIEHIKRVGKSALMGPHLVLANRAGEGNLSVLLGYGILPKGIIAVGESEEDAFFVQEKYPQLNVVCSNVISIAKEHRRKLVGATLTFDRTLTDAHIDTMVQTVQHGLKDDAVLGLTTRVDLKADPSSYEGLSKNTVISDDEGDIELLYSFDHLVQRSAVTLAGRFDIQSEYVSFVGYKVARLLGPYRTLIHPLAAYRFKEKESEAITILFSVRRLNKNLPERKFWLKHYDWVKNWEFFHADYTDIQEVELLEAVRSLSENVPKGISVPALLNTSADVLEKLENLYGGILDEKLRAGKDKDQS